MYCWLLFLRAEFVILSRLELWLLISSVNRSVSAINKHPDQWGIQNCKEHLENLCTPHWSTQLHTCFLSNLVHITLDLKFKKNMWDKENLIHSNSHSYKIWHELLSPETYMLHTTRSYSNSLEVHWKITWLVWL